MDIVIRGLNDDFATRVRWWEVVLPSCGSSAWSYYEGWIPTFFLFFCCSNMSSQRQKCLCCLNPMKWGKPCTQADESLTEIKKKSELVETGERDINRPGLHLTASFAELTKVGGGGEIMVNAWRFRSLLRWVLYRRNPPTDVSVAVDEVKELAEAACWLKNKRWAVH